MKALKVIGLRKAVRESQRIMEQFLQVRLLSVTEAIKLSRRIIIRPKWRGQPGGRDRDFLQTPGNIAKRGAEKIERVLFSTGGFIELQTDTNRAEELPLREEFPGISAFEDKLRILTANPGSKSTRE